APSARKRKSSRDPNSDREPNPRSLVRPLRQQAPEQDHVVQLVAAAVYPADEMVAVTPGGGPFATRPPAVLIPSDQGAAPRTPDRPLGAADVDRHRGLHEDPGDAAVAGPPLHRLGGDRKGELGLGARRTENAKQRFDRPGDLHLADDLAAGRRELDERI